MLEPKNSKAVQPEDHIRFRCLRCGKCCRHVRNSVMLQSVDGYRLAKYLQMEVADFFEQYADIAFLEDTGYPLFALKVRGAENACIFLKGNRCTVQEAKPQACRLYPFWIEPDDSTRGKTLLYHLSTEHRHHPKGSLIKVKDWMKENLTEDDKAFWTEEWSAMQYLAPLCKRVRENASKRDELSKLLLLYRYFYFDLDVPFQIQHRRNNMTLKHLLEKLTN